MVKNSSRIGGLHSIIPRQYRYAWGCVNFCRVLSSTESLFELCCIIKLCKKFHIRVRFTAGYISLIVENIKPRSCMVVNVMY